MESSRFSNVITVLALLAYINLISFVNAKMLNLLSRNNSENFILFFDNGDFILETNILLNLENPLLKAYIFPNNVSQNSPLNNEHLRERKFYSQQSCLHFTKKKNKKSGEVNSSRANQRLWNIRSLVFISDKRSLELVWKVRKREKVKNRVWEGVGIAFSFILLFFRAKLFFFFDRRKFPKRIPKENFVTRL